LNFLSFKINIDTMQAYIFPGQGAQHTGMGKDLFENSSIARAMFEKANEILGFNITQIMFEGSDEDLKQTRVTQPAIFLHSVILAKTLTEFNPDMVAGHSLGEFSALTASGALSFEDGLRLVFKRAAAMQKACEAEPSAMAAIVGLSDEIVEEACKEVDDNVIPANYNCPGQLVISGPVTGIERACKILLDKGARRAIKLPVSGGFHSRYMEPAREELEAAIRETIINRPACPVYQNVTAKAVTNPEDIRLNLTAQLTSPVRWTQTVLNMIADGATSFTEIGPGKVLQGLVRKIDGNAIVSGIN
jgi:[acyl-carrier-protein] S-malonyltransferase